MILLVQNEGIFGANAHILRYHANVINSFINANGHFPTEEAYDRQSLTLIEEVGECVGAGRRYLGMARRNGTLEDFGFELADVVIATHVHANMLKSALPTDERYILPLATHHSPRLAVVTLLREMPRTLASILDTDDVLHMDNLLCIAQHIAGVLTMDLASIVNTKLETIYSRGWKEGALNENPDQLALFTAHK